MKAKMSVQGNEYDITLNDSKAAKDFFNLFPLRLTLTDFNHTEKVANLPQKLDTTDSPSGTNAEIGDINYYKPWGNLCIFYKKFGHSQGLVNLGEIDNSSILLASFGDSFDIEFYK